MGRGKKRAMASSCGEGGNGGQLCIDDRTDARCLQQQHPGRRCGHCGMQKGRAARALAGARAAPIAIALPCPALRSLSHYLSDKRKNDKAVLEMAGKLTQQLAAGGGAGARASAAARSDEGLKAVVAAYETKQTELGKENRDLKAALASLQVRRGAWLGGKPLGTTAAMLPHPQTFTPPPKEKQKCPSATCPLPD